MNSVHKFVIDYIRKQSLEDQGELGSKFAEWSDERMVRTMFSNFRDQRGLRLTKYGLEIMKLYFRGCEVAIPEGASPHAKEIIYLDENAKLPYYCAMGSYVFYDLVFGVKVKLADGRIRTLIEIED